MEGVELVAVADVNAAGGQQVAEACHTRWVADYRTIAEEIDAAIVAVPTFAHHAVAGDLLDRGIPCLIEKPIALNVAQAEDLVARATKQNTLLQVGHVERFNPCWTAARPFLERPKYIRSERYSAYSFRSTDIGVVHDVMIHDIDLVLSIAGAPLKRVEGLGVSIVGGHEDCVQARLVFQNGCIADLSANRVSPVPRRGMQVWSAAGTTSIDFAAREVVHYAQGANLKYGTPLPDRARLPGANLEQLKSEVFGHFIKLERPVVSTADALTGELAAFVHSLRTGTAPAVSGPEALDAMRAAEAILEKVATHQWDGSADGAIGPTPHVGMPWRQAG